MMRVYNFPIRRRITIADPIDRLITGDTQRCGNWSTIIPHVVADCYSYHL